jgi:hypothetical protein
MSMAASQKSESRIQNAKRTRRTPIAESRTPIAESRTPKAVSRFSVETEIPRC